ncbi:MAG TPA: hypothetical protein VIJ19_02115 [Opitutaceae bacterium]
MQKTTLDFNREILFGECGALLAANPAAEVASHFTANPAVISSAAVAGTLLGGALFWLAARVYDKVRQKSFDRKSLASDIGYFTPAAILLGFLVYDPAIYLTSHHLLTSGEKVLSSVLLGQMVAFSLFLACMNLYRLLLIRVRGKVL